VPVDKPPADLFLAERRTNLSREGLSIVLAAFRAFSAISACSASMMS